MATSPDQTSMALFCDFENVALGVRDAKYDKFDIKRVLERLLLKGSIVVKKAYCDWERYKGFKATMHEANFELIEIPHVRQSGKNSADIRLVVDALDLCYTKSHVNTFVIISGDSDFSPLVSKLRENAKQVIGVGVKQSTSDLLIANCDEFIFYDDLVREGQRNARRDTAESSQAPKRTPEEDRRRREDTEKRQSKAFDLVMETFEALNAERGDGSKIRSSVLKDAIKRRRPDFNESYFGFRTFGGLLEEAQSRGLLELERDDKGNVFAQRSSAPVADAAALRQGLMAGGLVRPASAQERHEPAQADHGPASGADDAVDERPTGAEAAPQPAQARAPREPREARPPRERRERRERSSERAPSPREAAEAPSAAVAPVSAPPVDAPPPHDERQPAAKRQRPRRGGAAGEAALLRDRPAPAPAAAVASDAPRTPADQAQGQPGAPTAAGEASATAPRKTSSRSRRPRAAAKAPDGA